MFQTDGLIAKGSARSVNEIDLYELVKSQAYLLTNFGGHPLAANLSLCLENLPLFKEAINRQVFGRKNNLSFGVIQADLVVEVKDLGASLFKELKLLGPYGMGNRVPKLLIKKCWFSNVVRNSTKDKQTQQINMFKTKFCLIDDSCRTGFPGIWWGHNPEELPSQELVDVIVELEFNGQNDKNTNYHGRLIAFRPTQEQEKDYIEYRELILDWRQESPLEITEQELRLLEKCPTHWDEIFKAYTEAIKQKQKLALAYKPPLQLPPQQVWQQLVGIAKYLSRTGEIATTDQVKQKLGLTEVTLELGLKLLENMGFKLSKLVDHNQLYIAPTMGVLNVEEIRREIEAFMEAVAEEQFQQQYFAQVSLETIQNNVSFSMLVGKIVKYHRQP